MIKLMLLFVFIGTSLSSCNANQPFHPSYLIGLTNPCKSEVEFEITFNKEHQYYRDIAPRDQASYINLGMKKELLEQLGTDFFVTISSSKNKSKSYTKVEVEKYFYLGHDPKVQTTHWQVDAGEMCGKNLMKTKQEHLKTLQ